MPCFMTGSIDFQLLDRAQQQTVHEPSQHPRCGQNAQGQTDGRRAKADLGPKVTQSHKAQHRDQQGPQ